MAVDPQTSFIYVANAGNSQTGDPGSITVIDGKTNAATALTDSKAKNPVAIAANPVTNKIYAANSGSDNVSVIDGAHKLTQGRYMPAEANYDRQHEMSEGVIEFLDFYWTKRQTIDGALLSYRLLRNNNCSPLTAGFVNLNLRQPNPSNQVFEPRVGAERIE